jgi:hypothetical protein
MNWTKKKPIEPGAYWYRNDNWERPVQIDEEADGSLIVWQPGIDFPSRLADLRGEWAGPIPEPGEAIDADLARFVEAGTKAWADVPDASAWVEEQRGNKPERCGECGDLGTAKCYPRAATDKACKEARQ